MKLKISLLLFIATGWSFYSEAQTARNPLNYEPARVTLQKGFSSWTLSEEIFYRPDGTAFDKRSIQYDATGRKTAELTLRLNKSDQTWYQTTKNEYRFEENKEIVACMSGRKYTSKTEIISDASGRPLYSFIYSWNSGADDWSVSPSSRSEWKYDANGRVTECLKQYFNRIAREWNGFDVRIQYTYDETGALSEELFQTWNAQSGQWIDGGRYSYSNEGELRKVAASYIPASGNWAVDGKTVYHYDGDGKIVRCEYYKDNTLDAYSIHIYSEKSDCPAVIESHKITVFPNPVVSTFELTVPDDFTGKTMYLFDAWGTQVKALPIAVQTTQVDVSGLSGGVYLLKIGELSKKIILK